MQVRERKMWCAKYEEEDMADVLIFGVYRKWLVVKDLLVCPSLCRKGKGCQEGISRESDI